MQWSQAQVGRSLCAMRRGLQRPSPAHSDTGHHLDRLFNGCQAHRRQPLAGWSGAERAGVLPGICGGRRPIPRHAARGLAAPVGERRDLADNSRAALLMGSLAGEEEQGGVTEQLRARKQQPRRTPHFPV